MALDKGETALAEVAKRKAEQIESESLGMLLMRIISLKRKWNSLYRYDLLLILTKYFQKVMKSLLQYDFHGNKADTL